MLEDFTMPKGTHSKGYTRTLATRKGRGSLPSPEDDVPTGDTPPPRATIPIHAYIPIYNIEDSPTPRSVEATSVPSCRSGDSPDEPV